MQASFEAAYRGEFKPVWRFVSRLAPPSFVEDLVHDVFLTAHRRWSTYDPSRPLRPWLFGIACRVAADHRALKRHTVEVPEADHPKHEPAAEANPVTDRLDAQRLLTLALSQMPDDARAVFVMHELEEQPVPAIAEAMGTPVPTAYTRLRAARQVFERVVEPHRTQEGAR
ncbi:MAG: sigma-70 family RNA polymerase sigma factor [Myxococcaceae bacterium]|nr:sigma-70 family RNA polymerase sigma factor [Myxococcaceae bacterium]